MRQGQRCKLRSRPGGTSGRGERRGSRRRSCRHKAGAVLASGAAALAVMALAVGRRSVRAPRARCSPARWGRGRSTPASGGSPRQTSGRSTNSTIRWKGPTSWRPTRTSSTTTHDSSCLRGDDHAPWPVPTLAVLLAHHIRDESRPDGLPVDLDLRRTDQPRSGIDQSVPTRRSAQRKHRAYTITISGQTPPAEPAPNTLYGGQEGTTGETQQVEIILRYYRPTRD